MNKKDIYMELVYDIPELIGLQILTLESLKKNPAASQKAIDFQEDILKILQSVGKMDIINLNAN